MARPIRWLHLSDLHLGCPGRDLWEQVEEKFFTDVETLLGRLGAPDLLLFTGDLTYSGKESEYAQVDVFLDELLTRLGRTGAPEPILAAVPGNHDLARPGGREARPYFVLQSFDGTVDIPQVHELYQEFWQQRDASFINGLFPGYRAWFERRARPQLERRATSAHFSHFPCDFTAVVEPEGAFPLVLVGLNSTWMQYTGGDFDGKLLLPLEQFRAALAPAEERKPYAAFEDGARSLLLMYQRFVDARGYEDERWWEDGWAVREKKRWEGPGSWAEQLAKPNRPVVEVSWWEAMAYCRWFSEQRGIEIFLPTEAEWQATATHPKGAYPWGKAEPDEELANFAREMGRGNVGRPTPVGVYPRGAGLRGHLDLAGNVWEWCVDKLGDNSRPLRGGAWWSVAVYLQSAYRLRDWPDRRVVYFGFRVLAPASSTAL